jgi:hypothetical protein
MRFMFMFAKAFNIQPAVEHLFLRSLMLLIIPDRLLIVFIKVDRATLRLTKVKISVFDFSRDTRTSIV